MKTVDQKTDVGEAPVKIWKALASTLVLTLSDKAKEGDKPQSIDHGVVYEPGAPRRRMALSLQAARELIPTQLFIKA